MKCAVGLDVSQYECAMCILNEDGTRVFEGTCATDPDAIVRTIADLTGTVERIGTQPSLVGGSEHRTACAHHRQVWAQRRDIPQQRRRLRSEAGSIHLSWRQTLEEILATDADPAHRRQQGGLQKRRRQQEKRLGPCA